ncbi:hypothetical protein CTAYLR_009376 [Chrysophaeum taylorii]|uniref:Histidine kinase domain-containing protein n=1 Tax=Chrysophaeum taylorii TaxID=2483200 RepID=A0AAD7XQ06_9STRA|nr:hypothetical protein CTAYLR_009376 [Chrysophaeum taylorii]
MALSSRKRLGALVLAALLAVSWAVASYYVHTEVRGFSDTNELEVELRKLDLQVWLAGFMFATGTVNEEMVGLLVEDPHRMARKFRSRFRRAKRCTRRLREVSESVNAFLVAYEKIVHEQELYKTGGLEAVPEQAQDGSSLMTYTKTVTVLQDDLNDASDALKSQIWVFSLVSALFAFAIFCVLVMALGRAFLAEVRSEAAEAASSHNKTQLLLTTDKLEIQKKVLSQFTHELRNKYTPATHILEHILEHVGRPADELKGELLGVEDDVRLCVALLHEADQLIATRLDLHKVYAGRYQSSANVETVELNALLSQRVDVAATLAHKNVAFSAVVPDDLKEKEIFVRLDLYMFRHISNNLLSNARKHTHAGFVSLIFLEERDGQLCFAVRDSGRGIPESIASRLFMEEVGTADVRGVGLGLVSCSKFAEAVSGRVWLEATSACTLDDSSGGSEFRFSLPGKIVEGRSVDKPIQAPCNEGNLPRDLHVYIVEDSRIIRKSVVAKLGSVAKGVFGGRAAWTFAEFETVEAVLPFADEIAALPNALVTVDQNLDSCGGQLRGEDLIVHLKRAGCRAIIASASGDDLTATHHMSLGADVWFGKPLPKAEVLTELLRRAFASKAAAPTTPLLLESPMDF